MYDMSMFADFHSRLCNGIQLLVYYQAIKLTDGLVFNIW